MKLFELEKVFLETEKVATPHRTPDFGQIALKAKGGRNALVRGRFVLIEDHNTGYDGSLQRWAFTVPSDMVPEKKIMFYADILPGYLHEGSGPLVPGSSDTYK